MNKQQPHTSQSGFMLIEVLVSILIFSIGVLALIGLQARMTTAQTASKIRVDASYLASELIGIIWSDLPRIASYKTCASHNPCKEWQAKVTQNLPGGSGTVVVNDLTGQVDVTITWKQASEDQHTYQSSTFIKGVN
jgi:type IV pilus assembly protein PilV